MQMLSIWRHGAYVRFITGSGLSLVGTWFNTVAIAVLTYQLSGQVHAAAIAVMVAVLPRLLLSPLGGALADRFERRSLLLTLDCIGAGLALLPLLVHDRSGLPIVYASVLLLQAIGCVYRPAQTPYVAAIVPDRLLEAANATYSTIDNAAFFVGPALAAATVGLWGPRGGFIVNALSFAISAACLATLPRGEHPAERRSAAALLRGYAGIVHRYPRMIALCLVGFATVVPVFYFQSTIIAFAAAVGQPSSFIGVLYAAAGIGGIIGGLAMGQFQQRLSTRATLAIYFLVAPMLAGLSLLHQAPLALVLLAGSVAASTTGDLVFSIHIQRSIAPDERGRAGGLLGWILAGGQVIGATMGTLVAPGASVAALLWIGILVLPISLLGLKLYLQGAPRDTRHLVPAPALS